MTLKDSPSDLQHQPLAVWLKDGEISIDFNLGNEICEALDYPAGTSIGFAITPARARMIADQLVEGAAFVESNAPTVPLPKPAGEHVVVDENVEEIRHPDEVEILGAPSKERFAHMIHLMAAQIVEQEPGIDCTVVELLQHATGRARKAQQH